MGKILPSNTRIIYIWVAFKRYLNQLYLKSSYHCSIVQITITYNKKYNKRGKYKNLLKRSFILLNCIIYLKICLQ